MARNQGKNTNVNWGICTNTSGKEDGTPCSKCQNKEKQAIRATKEFVCEECKEPLTRIAPPPPPPPWALIIGIAVVVIGLCVGGYFLGKSIKAKKAEKVELERVEKAKTEAARIDSINKAKEQQITRDSIQQVEKLRLAEEQRIADSTAKAKMTKPVKTGNWGTCKWKGVATYEGPMQGGKPHGGGGTLKFKSNYTLNLKDGNGGKLEIKAGESIRNAKCKNGELIQGELQRNNGNRKWFNIGA